MSKPTPVAPTDLGGFQHIVHGEIKAGDLLVWHEGTEQKIQPVEMLIGIAVVCLKDECRIYRRMPVPSSAPGSATITHV